MERDDRRRQRSPEVETILAELRPLIDRLVQRDRVMLVRELVRTGPGIA
jgi:hypothetical protein